MEKNKINYVGIIGCVILYAVTSFASAFIGFLNPWCWVVLFPMLAAVLGAPTYLWVASRWQRFGVATVFALVLAAVLLPMGEINFPQCVLMIAAGMVSDTIRQLMGNKSKQAVFFAYPVLSLGVIAWFMQLWNHTEGYCLGAAEEISIDYAEGLKALSSIRALVMVIFLVIVAGYIAIRISAAKMKSPQLSSE
jgi:membrane protein insertase Oxa1/YidC/SpoIIIJ